MNFNWEIYKELNPDLEKVCLDFYSSLCKISDVNLTDVIVYNSDIMFSVSAKQSVLNDLRNKIVQTFPTISSSQVKKIVDTVNTAVEKIVNDALTNCAKLSASFPVI